ncbi:hypothetical protein DFH11DRAFT_1879914 [Phellopilus nigrolimitatus]|nr:hypothetical protein DFH11DRAFT_1879914 [Phellopilus nigrolimitatus]
MLEIERALEKLARDFLRHARRAECHNGDKHGLVWKITTVGKRAIEASIAQARCQSSAVSPNPRRARLFNARNSTPPTPPNGLPTLDHPRLPSDTLSDGRRVAGMPNELKKTPYTVYDGDAFEIIAIVPHAEGEDSMLIRSLHRATQQRHRQCSRRHQPRPPPLLDARTSVDAAGADIATARPGSGYGLTDGSFATRQASSGAGRKLTVPRSNRTHLDHTYGSALPLARSVHEAPRQTRPGRSASTRGR